MAKKNYVKTTTAPTELSREFAKKLLDALANDLLCGSLAELFYWCFRQHLHLLLWTGSDFQHLINCGIVVFRVKPNVAALWNILLHPVPASPVHGNLSRKVGVAYLLGVIPVYKGVFWTDVENRPILNHPTKLTVPILLTVFNI